MEKETKQKIKDFTDLIVWQNAYKLALSIQESTKHFPKEEMYGITSQIRRSVQSVTANIAEGFGRHTYKEKIHFYYQAHGSLVETKNHLLLAKGFKYLSVQEFASIEKIMIDVHKLLLGLIRSTKKLAYPNSKI